MRRDLRKEVSHVQSRPVPHALGKWTVGTRVDLLYSAARSLLGFPRIDLLLIAVSLD